jgi:ATP-dependent exoDNAse (exonuclease V) alpha subunit
MNTSNITLSTQQEKILDALKSFVQQDSKRVFILKGYAGTGKTTLMRFLIQELKRKKIQFRLLAPTGRAAKVLSNVCDTEAATIHSMIYTFTDLNKDLSETKETELIVGKTGQLFLNFEAVTLNTEDTEPTIYVVDESSMVADVEEKNITQAKFGSGRLLKELLAFDPRPQSKFIFVGDPCQLPPIQEVQSPALNPEYFRQHFGMTAEEHSLTQIFRQSDDSTLIPASQQIRKLCENAPEKETVYGYQRVWGRVPLRHCKETSLYYDFGAMTDKYVEIVKHEGYNSAIFITPSNKKCAELSAIIRNKLGIVNLQLQEGDLLMVIQNNYPTGLMNGDMVEVMKISYEKAFLLANLTFVPVKLRELFTKREVASLLLTDTLYSGTLNLDSGKQTALFVDFVQRMKKRCITQKHNKEQFHEALLRDSYLNALRCNFGYAVTCHKAQGGEWKHVFVDMSNKLLNPTKEKYQWIYTAVTRTQQYIHLLNKPFIE